MLAREASVRDARVSAASLIDLQESCRGIPRQLQQHGLQQGHCRVLQVRVQQLAAQDGDSCRYASCLKELMHRRG